MSYEGLPRFSGKINHPNFRSTELLVQDPDPKTEYVAAQTYATNYLVALTFALYGDLPRFTGKSTDKEVVKAGRDSLFDFVVGDMYKTDGTYPRSSLQFIGATFQEIDGRVVFVMDGPVAVFDKIGDRLLRRFDDNILADPVAVWMRREVQAHKQLNARFFAEGGLKELPVKAAAHVLSLVAQDRVDAIKDFREMVLGHVPKRWRGTAGRIAENIEKLGFRDHYGFDIRGVHIKQPEKFFGQIPLQDIMRAKELGATTLVDHDIDEICKLMSKKIKEVHTRANGGFGELLINDFFCVVENGKVVDFLFNVPDIVYHTKVPSQEQKAIDYMDIIFSSSMEMIRRGDDWDTISRRLGYLVSDADSDIKQLVLHKLGNRQMTLTDYQSDNDMWQSFVRGLLAQHNMARFFVLHPESVQYVRMIAMDVLAA